MRKFGNYISYNECPTGYQLKRDVCTPCGRGYYKSVIGGETERIDNTADTSILNKFGWRAKINLYSYIEENRNVN